MGLSPWDVITFLPRAGIFASSLGAAVILSPLRSRDHGKTLGEHIERHIFRTACNIFSVDQIQAVLPPTEAVYRAHNKKLGEPVVVVDLPNTTIKGVWLGNRNTATDYLVYFHGGGFVIPAVDQHFALLQRIVNWSGGKIAIFVPAYNLSPNVRYPQPIREAAEAVKYVAGLAASESATKGKKKKGLSIAGDSAGGNLVVAILSLLAGHGTDDLAPLQLPATDDDALPPLKSAVAIAPWVSSDYNKFPQMVPAGNVDILSYKALDYFSLVYKGAGTKDDNFIVPELADPSWWEPVKGKVGSVLVLAGDNEVLRDPIVSWYAKFERAFGKESSRLLVAQNEVHDQLLTPKSEAELAVVGDGETQEGALKRWAEKLSEE
ncbi:hypothetical protein DV735_g2716, partial [Chaetothyriales sp. CBS 134920]